MSEFTCTEGFPWYTGVVLKLLNFFGKIGDDNQMNVRQNLICTHSSMASQLIQKPEFPFHP